MRKTAIAIAFLALTFVGCKSKQDQFAELNAQFDILNAQYQKNCITAPIEEMKHNDAKCKAERDEMNPLGKRMMDLQNDIAASKR
jgi:hypothetical protein